MSGDDNGYIEHHFQDISELRRLCVDREYYRLEVFSLRAQLEAAEAEARENFQKYVDANEARIDAEAEALKFRVDAERYAWLRDGAQIIKVTSGQVISYPFVRLYESIHGPDFRGNPDAAIDAARTETM